MSRINTDLSDSSQSDIDLTYDPFVDDDAQLRGGYRFAWENASPHSQAHVNNQLKPPGGGGGGGGGGGSTVPPTQALATTLGPNFNSLPALNGGYTFIPPDNASAVSGSAVVLAVNGEVQIYQRTGGSGLATGPATTSLDGFFPTGANTFDPRVIYDPAHDKLIVVAADQATNPDTSDFWVAVSADGTGAAGTWTYQHINTALTINGQLSWADFPQVGVDNKGNIYLTGNMFAFSGSYEGARTWITNETNTASTMVDASNAANLSSDLFSLTPANMAEPGAKTAGIGEYLVSYNSARNSANHNVLDVLHLTSGGSWVHTQVDVGLIDALKSGGVTAPQPGTSQTLDADDTRVASVVYKDGVLYVAADIVPVSGVDAGHTTAHWWALSTDSATGAVTGLISQGDISGNTYAYGSNLRSFYPSLAVEGNGALAVSFSGSGPTNGTASGRPYTGYASAYEAVVADPIHGGPHQETGAWQLVEAGVASYYRTFGGADNRWGDYSSISTDPTDPSHVWAFNEYAMQHGSISGSQNGVWGTALGYF